MLTPARIVYAAGFLALCWCVAGIADLLIQLHRAEKHPLPVKVKGTSITEAWRAANVRDGLV